MLSSCHIVKCQTSLLKAPLIQSFRTALGTHENLENCLFSLELGDGTKGLGEAAIATHITGETAAETLDNLKAITPNLKGRDISDYLKISAQLHAAFPTNKAAVAAVESAVLDALTRQLKIPLWKFFGSFCQKLKSDITIVIANLKETEDSVKKFYRQGFRAFKVKIGKDEKLDYERVLAVSRLAPRCAIYLDANQGYSAEQTLRFLKLLQAAGIKPQLIEQPVPKDDWEGLKRVARLSKVPVCADESVRSLSDAVRAIREKAVPVINIKLMKCGLIQAREIALLAKANGIKLMIGGMMETSLAMMTSAHLAAGLGCFDYIDLDTPFFIKDGLKNSPFLTSSGVYDLQKAKYGIGIRQ